MFRVSFKGRDAIAMGFYFYIGWSAAKAIDIYLGKVITRSINEKENEENGEE